MDEQVNLPVERGTFVFVARPILKYQEFRRSSADSILNYIPPVAYGVPGTPRKSELRGTPGNSGTLKRFVLDICLTLTQAQAVSS